MSLEIQIYTAHSELGIASLINSSNVLYFEQVRLKRNQFYICEGIVQNSGDLII